LKKGTAVVASAAVTVLLAGCHVDQWVQPRVNSGAASDFYSDRQGDRPDVAGTVSFNGYVAPDERTTGRNGKVFAQVIPAASVKAFGGATSMLKRGQERYNIYCQPCHGVAGDGNGFVALRGMGYWQKLPANLLDNKYGAYKPGQFFDVIANGKGAMYSYSSRIPDVDDRWAVVAYISALREAGKLPLPANLNDSMHGDAPKEHGTGHSASGNESGHASEGEHN
jgi:mono/diheme cytochrome c family protein